MDTKILKFDLSKEFLTSEGCYIVENWNDKSDKAVSIARARVKSGVTTQWHKLNGIEERYIIISGKGKVSVGDLEPANVEAGDVVLIPSGKAQRIENIGDEDLIFYCICTSRFEQEYYEAL